jgi:hypothetical protein
MTTSPPSRGSERRHEFFDGVIVAMADDSDEHNAIASRFAGLFVARVRRGCRLHTRSEILDRSNHACSLQRGLDHMWQA